VDADMDLSMAKDDPIRANPDVDLAQFIYYSFMLMKGVP
jgi:hypothetical protein